MDFIFMLTRQDRTVPDACAVLEAIGQLGLKHIGFKDVGAELETLRALNGLIKALGAVSYLEMVATTPEAGIGYFPFPGTPSGHPTRLGGSLEQVAAQSAAFLEMGCAGVDLLAYRATEAEPIALVRAARRGMGEKGALICAGGVDSPARIAALREAGCDAFTVGSAAFDLAFSGAATLSGQLEDILRCA
jgi:hypothetical protein